MFQTPDINIPRGLIFLVAIFAFIINGLSFESGAPKSVRASAIEGEGLGVVTQRYRLRHSGIDIAAPRGTLLPAFTKGEVVKVGNEDAFCRGRGYGKFVMIESDEGYTFLYAHLDTIKVEKGDDVDQKEIIGTVGSTGYATGPHLHLTLFKTSTLKNESHACGERLWGETINPELHITDL